MTPAKETQDQGSPPLAPFIAAFIALSAAILYIGHLYYSTKQLYFKEQTELTISAIAELKVNQLTNWWSAGNADCQRIRSNGFLVEHLVGAARGRERAKSVGLILDWMGSLQETGGYQSVFLLDTTGRILFFRGQEDSALDAQEMKTLHEVVRSHGISFTDLHLSDPGGRVCCDFFAPVIDTRPDGEIIAGIIALRVDPSRQVYPLITTWPNPSPSSEMNLLGRDGSDIVYLSAPRHRKVNPLRLRLPSTDTSLVAVQAARGSEGFVEGADYRGIQVKAFISRVPRTPWMLVAQTELSELDDPLNGIAKWVTSLSLAMIIATGLGLSFWRRHRQAQNYQVRLREETQRNQALAALHIAEERFTKVFRRSPVPMWIARFSDGTILDVNESFVTLFGYTPAEIIGHPSTDFQIWNASDGRQESMESLAEKGSAVNLEYPLRKKSGETGMQLLSSERIHLDGEPCLLITAVDITSRKMMEEALRESNERFEKVFRNSPVLMSLASMDDGTIVEVNDAATQVLGFSRSEVVGKTFEEVGWMSGDDRARILTALKYHDRIHNLELPMHRKDGETVHCNVNGEIVNHRGKRFLLSVAEDITEQKRFQEQLARSAREKEELLKELQHRVKNNLSLIAALLEFGMNSVSDDRSKQAFVDAQSRIRTMSRMYEQLYQSSALKDIEADLYLSQLANSLVRTYAVNAEKIQLTLDLEPVKMDMKRMVPIGLIVNELVTNAVKYAFPDDRTGEVRLSFEKLNKHIVLSVSDDGVGLPKGIDVKRAESLGLSIVSMLADQIDAELVVTGTKGTTVSLTFEL